MSINRPKKYHILPKFLNKNVHNQKKVSNVPLTETKVSINFAKKIGQDSLVFEENWPIFISAGVCGTPSFS